MTNSFHFEEITSNPVPGACVCKVSGALDISTSGELEQLAGQRIKTGREVLIFDLSELDYINSQGLSALLSLHRTLDRSGGGLVLVAASERVRKILEVTGLDLAIAHYSDMNEALAKDPLLASKGRKE
jgi:anti-sigma B factor antagonist